LVNGLIGVRSRSGSNLATNLHAFTIVVGRSRLAKLESMTCVYIGNSTYIKGIKLYEGKNEKLEVVKLKAGMEGRQ